MDNTDTCKSSVDRHISALESNCDNSNEFVLGWIVSYLEKIDLGAEFARFDDVVLCLEGMGYSSDFVLNEDDYSSDGFARGVIGNAINYMEKGVQPLLSISDDLSFYRELVGMEEKKVSSDGPG